MRYGTGMSIFDFVVFYILTKTEKHHLGYVIRLSSVQGLVENSIIEILVFNYG